MNSFLDFIKYSDIDFCTFFDLLDLFCIFYQIMSWNDMSLMCDLRDLIIEHFMADFVFSAATAPTRVITINFF